MVEICSTKRISDEDFFSAPSSTVNTVGSGKKPFLRNNGRSAEHGFSTPGVKFMKQFRPTYMANS
jgi:hypothetical protein